MSHRFLPFRADTDMAQLLAILNKNFGELDNEAVTKVFSVSASNPGFIQGKLPNDLGYGFLMYTPDNKVAIACYIDSSGQPVLKIAKDGFDALTASNDQLIFNSAQNVFKIVTNGTGSFPAATATVGGGGGWSEDFQQTQIAHNLGYIPVVLAYVEFSSHRIPCPLGHTQTDAFGAAFLHLEVSVDSTNVVLSTDVIRNGAGSSSFGPYDCKYYLLQETAN